MNSFYSLQHHFSFSVVLCYFFTDIKKSKVMLTSNNTVFFFFSVCFVSASLLSLFFFSLVFFCNFCLAAWSALMFALQQKQKVSRFFIFFLFFIFNYYLLFLSCSISFSWSQTNFRYVTVGVCEIVTCMLVMHWGISIDLLKRHNPHYYLHLYNCIKVHDADLTFLSSISPLHFFYFIFFIIYFFYKSYWNLKGFISS